MYVQKKRFSIQLEKRRKNSNGSPDLHFFRVVYLSKNHEFLFLFGKSSTIYARVLVSSIYTQRTFLYFSNKKGRFPQTKIVFFFFFACFQNGTIIFVFQYISVWRGKITMNFSYYDNHNETVLLLFFSLSN